MVVIKNKYKLWTKYWNTWWNARFWCLSWYFDHITHQQPEVVLASSLCRYLFLVQVLSSEKAAAMSAALVTHKHVCLCVWRAFPRRRIVKTSTNPKCFESESLQVSCDLSSATWAGSQFISCLFSGSPTYRCHWPHYDWRPYGCQKTSRSPSSPFRRTRILTQGRRCSPACCCLSSHLNQTIKVMWKIIRRFK